MQPRLQKGRYLYEVELVARGYTGLGQGWRRRLLVLHAGQVTRAGRRGDRVMNAARSSRYWGAAAVWPLAAAKEYARLAVEMGPERVRADDSRSLQSSCPSLVGPGHLMTEQKS